MDEALEIVDIAADSGLEGALAWLLRIVGFVLVLAGIGAWLLTDVTVLVPVGLVVVGLVLLVVPSILLSLTELAG